MTVKTVNGHKYSMGEFDGWKYRAHFTIQPPDKCQSSLNVFTTNPIRKDFNDMLVNILTKKGQKYIDEFTGVTGWTTKEQDDATAELIEETLSNWK